MATGSWSRLPQQVPPGFAHLRLRTRPQNPLSMRLAVCTTVLVCPLRKPLGGAAAGHLVRNGGWEQERQVGTILHPREMRWWPTALPLTWWRGAQTCTWIPGKPLTADVVNSGFAPIGALRACLKEGRTSI